MGSLAAFCVQLWVLCCCVSFDGRTFAVGFESRQGRFERVECSAQSSSSDSTSCAVFCLQEESCLAYRLDAYDGTCQTFQQHQLQCDTAADFFNLVSPQRNSSASAGPVVCGGSYVGDNCDRFMSDCAEGYANGKTVDGVYTIQPNGCPEPFQVRCEFGSVIKIFIQQRRKLNTPPPANQTFDRSWDDYKNGFGDIEGDYWLGLDRIHYLTNNGAQTFLFVYFFVDDVTWYGVYYKGFRVEDEGTDFTAHLGSHLPSLGLAGTQLADDALSDGAGPSYTINGMKFSTYDRDNDKSDDRNCALDLQAGWWFNNCTLVNLNGPKIDFNGPRNPSVPSVFWNQGVASDVTILDMGMALLMIV